MTDVPVFDTQEKFDTGLKRIGHEIKSRLVTHGIFGSVTVQHDGPPGEPAGSRVELRAKGRTAARSFDRRQIEGCCLRVGGEVLLGIMAMIDEITQGA